jgi:hypothetical protein
MLGEKERSYKMSRLQDAYRMVYNDMLNGGCEMLVGKYDATNGSEVYMHGVNMVMEWIAYRVSDEDGDAFCELFVKNMCESEQKAKCKRCAEYKDCYAGQNGGAKVGCPCFSPIGK